MLSSFLPPQRPTRYRSPFCPDASDTIFTAFTIDTIAARLDELLKIEGVEAEEKAVRYVAKAGDGSMRDALKPSGSVHCLLSGADTDL